MRGTRDQPATERPLPGIIPAYAGNTWAPSFLWFLWGAHPRVCGDHAFCSFVSSFARGSSPRMRGTPTDAPAWRRVRGIIPAYAGNTKSTSPFGHGARDHPRVCGEHLRPGQRDGSWMGSSPRMRGTQVVEGCAGGDLGIIPAYAGNTACSVTVVSWLRDHPRVCGEHYGSRNANVAGAGSSPRMRGTHHQRHRKTRRPGIIPAYAGNTMTGRRCSRIGRDHPRVCGEHVIAPVAAALAAGSSPRMRGTLAPSWILIFTVGIIPAYAGNT